MHHHLKILLFTAMLTLLSPAYSYAQSEDTDSEESEQQYGAIAFSIKTTDFATSAQLPTRKEAEKLALKRCKNDNPSAPRDCQIVVWFFNQCGALAIHRPPKAYNRLYWNAAYAEDEESAKAKALRACKKRGKSCEIITSVCSQ